MINQLIWKLNVYEQNWNAHSTVYARRQERLAEDERFFLEFQKKNWVVVKLHYWEEAEKS